MNAKIVSVAATVVIGTAALWFGLQAGGSADTPVRAHENASPVAQDFARRPAQPPAVTADQRQSASAEPSTATSPQLRRIGGRVVDTDGRPAATVAVKLFECVECSNVFEAAKKPKQCSECGGRLIAQE